jgi:hypothetical protein
MSGRAAGISERVNHAITGELVDLHSWARCDALIIHPICTPPTPPTALLIMLRDDNKEIIAS